MRHDDRGHVVPLLRGDHQIIDDVARDGIESRRRLIVKNNLRLHRERPREADAFAHAAG